MNSLVSELSLPSSWFLCGILVSLAYGSEQQTNHMWQAVWHSFSHGPGIAWFGGSCVQKVSEVLPCEPWASVGVFSVGVTGFTNSYLHDLEGALWDFAERKAVCDVFLFFIFFHFQLLMSWKVDLNYKYCFYQTGRSFLETRRKLVHPALHI